MPLEIRERDLPSVGVRYEVDLTHSASLAIVVSNTGERWLYYRDDPDADYEKITELTDSQARAIGLVLAGAYYQPVPARAGDVTPTDEHVKWYQVSETAAAIETQIGDLDAVTDAEAAILAVVRDGKRTANPPNDFILQLDDHLVVIGDQTAHGRLDEVL